MSSAYVAVDLGAESGRVVVVSLDDHRIELHEIHRFPNRPVQLPSGLHWDITSLWNEICRGLTFAAEWANEKKVALSSVGVDTWGVDWALLAESGELVGLPHAYRDPRNHAAFERATSIVNTADIYRATGIQIMPINTLFSVYAQQLFGPDLLRAADQLVFIPDLIHYWLSGKRQVESTIASTSQMIDVRNGNWCDQLLQTLGIPTSLCSETSPPGTVLGPLRDEIAKQTELNSSTRIVTPASHDTASAVAAVPADADSNWCFLSSGTWSLFGAELTEPCISLPAQSAMFTNEVGVGGTIRFLKNIAGLWLIQQCRNEFALRDQSYNYAELTELAGLAEPFRTLVDPDHPPFQAPGGMLTKIDDYARQTDQPPPETPGDYLRCCLESLALAYRQTLLKLEFVLNREFDVIHVVGGGGRNELLNQMTAGATGRPVVVGPFEATAIGNALVQAMALGDISDLAELRQIVKNSIDYRAIEPQDEPAWLEAYQRFTQLPGRQPVATTS